MKLIDLIGDELKHIYQTDCDENVRAMASQFDDLRHMILLVNELVAWSDERSSHDDNTAHSNTLISDTIHDLANEEIKSVDNPYMQPTTTFSGRRIYNSPNTIKPLNDF